MDWRERGKGGKSQQPDHVICHSSVGSLAGAKPAAILPSSLHTSKEFADDFSKPAADQLPPHRQQDHVIKVQEGKVPLHRRSYGMTKDELAAAK